jgi:hypothetical protein
MTKLRTLLATHLLLTIYLEAELPYVPQQSYPELNAYRENLKKLCKAAPSNHSLTKRSSTRSAKPARTTRSSSSKPP